MPRINKVKYEMGRMLTHGLLREVLTYDPASGKFFWNINRGGRGARAGGEAGHRLKTGYVTIWALGVRYSAHRLAWFYMTGAWPVSQIDHINRNKTDNRWSNLREASPRQNTANTAARSDSTVGAKGVKYHNGARLKRWQARIEIGGRQKSLGYFLSKGEAAVAYAKAAAEIHGEFAAKSEFF